MWKPQTCVVTGGSKGITITGTTADSHTYQCREHPPPPSTPWPTTTDSHTYQCREHPPPPSTPWPTTADSHTYQCREHPPPPSKPWPTTQTVFCRRKILSGVHWRRKVHIFLFLWNITGHLQENLYRQKIWKTTVYNCKSLGITKKKKKVKHCIYHPTFINKNNNKVTQNNC